MLDKHIKQFSKPPVPGSAMTHANQLTILKTLRELKELKENELKK